jgi:hypothetical protein
MLDLKHLPVATGSMREHCREPTYVGSPEGRRTQRKAWDENPKLLNKERSSQDRPDFCRDAKILKASAPIRPIRVLFPPHFITILCQGSISAFRPPGISNVELYSVTIAGPLSVAPGFRVSRR